MLLEKVLANSLKKVARKMLSLSQHAFVKGRQILDATFHCQRGYGFLLRSIECDVIGKL